MLSVAVVVPMETGWLQFQQTWGCRAVQPSPRRAHRHRKGLAGIAVWEHALHTAWCSQLEGSSRRNKGSILSGVWLEEWREELVESTSKRLQKLSWLSECVCGFFLSANELSQIPGDMQQLKFGSVLRVYVTISHSACLWKENLELIFHWKAF